MLEVDKLTVRFGAVTAFEDVDIKISEGEIVGLVGHNGAGKTTLFRAICGLEAAESGTVKLGGEVVTGERADRMARRQLAFVPQGKAIFGEMSVADNLRLARSAATGQGLSEERLFEIFPILREKQAEFARSLSGGQQQMLALSLALARGPKIILLDEPSTGLAPVLVQNVFEIVRQLNAELRTTFLIIDQNVEMLLRLADRTYVLKAGRMVYDGPSAELSGAALWSYF
ncbi:ABC transporter ATP-binding protein [Pelagibacterium lacus]|nr:ABC transporter ATP-binding protein [Pelagibacterium lacus]